LSVSYSTVLLQQDLLLLLLGVLVLRLVLHGEDGLGLRLLLHEREWSHLACMLQIGRSACHLLMMLWDWVELRLSLAGSLLLLVLDLLVLLSLGDLAHRGQSAWLLRLLRMLLLMA
jgi:hypothetical protein